MGLTMLRELYQYIGESIIFEGMRCQLIEILEDGPHLVFQCPDKQSIIQTNQHGDATRRSPTTYTVPLLSSVENDLHPVVKELLPEEQHEKYRTYFCNA